MIHQLIPIKVLITVSGVLNFVLCDKDMRNSNIVKRGLKWCETGKWEYTWFHTLWVMALVCYNGCRRKYLNMSDSRRRQTLIWRDAECVYKRKPVFVQLCDWHYKGFHCHFAKGFRCVEIMRFDHIVYEIVFCSMILSSISTQNWAESRQPWHMLSPLIRLARK